MKKIRERKTEAIINKGFNTKKTKSLIETIAEDEFSQEIASGKVVCSTPHPGLKKIKNVCAPTGRYNLRPRLKVQNEVVLHVKENVLEKKENNSDKKQSSVRGKKLKLVVQEKNKKESLLRKPSTELRDTKKIKSEPVKQPTPKINEIEKKNVCNVKLVAKLQCDSTVKISEEKTATISRGLKRKNIELSEQQTKRRVTRNCRTLAMKLK